MRRAGYAHGLNWKDKEEKVSGAAEILLRWADAWTFLMTQHLAWSSITFSLGDVHASHSIGNLFEFLLVFDRENVALCSAPARSISQHKRAGFIRRDISIHPHALSRDRAQLT